MIIQTDQSFLVKQQKTRSSITTRITNCGRLILQHVDCLTPKNQDDFSLDWSTDWSFDGSFDVSFDGSFDWY